MRSVEIWIAHQAVKNSGKLPSHQKRDDKVAVTEWWM